ncbi:DUF805 domain-containing protein [Longivirga aurantiaca]|uniref:DUF805 domain-containing protein n=1 Tax=Longivirga aurantiaca TaxID=1837743 RepID=A0ABW1T478_9ACTN
MGPTQAVSSVFSKFATFSGRARRSEYWWFVAFSIVVLAIALVIDNVAGLKLEGQQIGWVYTAVALLLVIPSIAVTVRRLHDTGRSGWWWFLSLVCGIGAIILFVFCLMEGTRGENEYGPDPKA